MRALACWLLLGFISSVSAQTCGCRAYYDNAQTRPADDMLKCNAAQDGQSATCAVIGTTKADLQLFLTCRSNNGTTATSPITVKPGASRYFLSLANVNGQLTFTLAGTTFATSQKQGSITQIGSDVHNGTLMNIKTTITVDPRDIGKAAKTFFVYYYESEAGAKPEFSGLWAYYTYSGGYKWIWWSLPNGLLPDAPEPRIYNTPHNPADSACSFPCLPTMRDYPSLPASIDINLPVTFFPYYDDQTPSVKIPVIYELYLGYVTFDGHMVINPFMDNRSIYRFMLTAENSKLQSDAPVAGIAAPRPSTASMPE